MKSREVRKRLKRVVSSFMIIAMLFSIVPISPRDWSFAVPVGDEIDVTSIRFVREHNGFNTVGAYVEIAGSGLQGKTIRFEKAGLGGGFEEIGEKVIDEDTFVKFTFEPEDAEVLAGSMRIGTSEIDLGLETFPNLSAIDQQNINLSKYGETPTDSDAVLTITGNNLDQIGTVTSGSSITAKYGRVQSRLIDGTQSYVDFAPDYSSVTLTEPPLPGEKGFQNIIIEKKDTSAGYTTSVEYLYANSFRFMEDLGLTEPLMFPNTGAKGDFVYFTAPNFVDTKNYDAYFLKTLDGSDQFSEDNKAEYVALELGELPEDEDRLIVKVPDDPDFELRSYYVVLTNTVNDEIIAEQVMLNSEGNPDQFTVIGSGFQPTIESIFPQKGPDTGSNVQISGRNILTLNLPDLESNGNFKTVAAPDQNPSGQDNNKTLQIEYDETDMTYKGQAATTTRNIKVQIGKETYFVQNPDGTFNVSKGLPDSMLVLTDTIDDALTDPFKDVVIEIETVVTETISGKKYTFSQIVTLQDGYEFEPSTLTPVVDEVTPDTIQIEDYSIDVGDGPIDFNKFSEDTLIAIKGSQFLVDKEVDEDGNAFVRYPTVLIKKNNDNTFTTKYQLGFFPNETVDGVLGVIKYKTDENEIEEYVLRDNKGKPVKLEITVVDGDNNIMDGTEGNDVGTKILIKIPSIALLGDGGIKHVQVTNPRRQSDEFGASVIKSDTISFVQTTDVPVIETVAPQITTVEGDVDVTITGANFQDGVRVFLDGEEITDLTKDIAPDGEKILLTFTAPPGRPGTTQLQVINPNGGLAVKDFTYVTTFAQDPVFEDFNPKRGTEDTLVVIDGDNFLKPDPTSPGTTGYDGLRLIGTRVYLDGKDVNQYVYDSLGNIDFEAYTSPDNEPVIYSEAGKALYSPFYENTYVTRDSDGKVFYLGRDEDKNPRITNNEDEWYDIRRNSADTGYEAFDTDGEKIGNVTLTYINGVTTVAISGGSTFHIAMNNNVILTKKDAAGVDYADIADYAESIVLTDGLSYYTLTKNFEGDIRLSNGKDNLYTIRWDDDKKKLIATKDTGGTQDVTVAPDGSKLTIGVDTDLTYLTPYVVDPDNNQITGDRTDVVSKFQVAIRVPGLTTGKGYKDIRVVNPDTKYAEKIDENGFYYITQPSSSPVITRVDPKKGATEGGYVINVYGYDFREGMKIFIDSVEVPEDETFVNIDGDMATIRVPPYKKDLIDLFGVDEIDVSVIVLNQDGGSDALPDGFKYIIPVSSPQIQQVLPADGSSTGGEIVEILGFEFRYFEPYENKVGGSEYNPGDDYEDLHPNGKWDDLLDINDTTDTDGDEIVDIITKVPDSQTPYFDYYLESKVLPTVYFGEEKAKIVEFSEGYMKVITPKREAGTVQVTVVNNDLGVSNEVPFTFTASAPTITTVSPNKGRKQGVEIKDVYGSEFYRSVIYGYTDNDDDSIVELSDIETIVRFGAIDNTDIAREQPNSGLIFNKRTTVELEGGLTVSYDGDANTITMSVEENGKVYTRVFNNYDDTEAYFPMEMLTSGSTYYTPNGYTEGDGSTYTNKIFEYVRMYIKDKRLMVERGYAPKVEYDNINHIVVTTPSYYTIDPVPMTITNPDGGTATTTFTYTNPDSNPKIYSVGANTLSPDQTYWMVEGAVNGNIEIEILGQDFRENLTVRIGNKEATVQERTTKEVDGVIYDVLIVTVPNGTNTDLDQKYPVLVENEDNGIANSATLDNLIGPNYGAKTLPFYFIYRKPLSAPTIESVIPAETSVYGGHEVVITGKDFRAGAIVVIGTVGGIPITDVDIENNGTIIKFTTPKDMVVGDKAVVVQNADFGQAVLEGGLKVVSYPQIETVLDEDGQGRAGRLSVEGGQVITIKGSSFQDGAQVIFSGTRSEYSDVDQVGQVGLWRDDKRYIIENGTLAASVEYVDSQTLRVTTPQLNKEDDLVLTIINPDTGLSDGDTTVEYSQPVPSDPIGLDVEMVDDHFIKLFDYASDDVEYYEIYYYIGDKAVHKLINDDYEDFSYLATTNIEPYKITKLPGFERAGKGDKIAFVLRAVNAFGASEQSNIAYLTFDEFEDVEYIGEPDVDGGLDVPAGEDYRHIADGNDSMVDIAAEDLPVKLEIDLREFELPDTVVRMITVPSEPVKNSGSVVYVDYGDMKIQFMPINLNTDTFREMNFYYDTYGRITANWEDGAYSSLLQGDIPRGQRAASSVFKIQFSAVSNREEKDFNTVNGNMDIVLPYDPFMLRNSDESTIELYKYDSEMKMWVNYPATLNTTTDEVHARINEAGYYMLMADR